MSMVNVDYPTFNEVMRIHSNLSPEPDFTDDECVTEDYWDMLRSKVVGYIRYFNDGQVIQCVLEELIPKEQLC